jgi:hypothetical protein
MDFGDVIIDEAEPLFCSSSSAAADVTIAEDFGIPITFTL